MMIFGLNEKCASVRSIELPAKLRRQVAKNRSHEWIEKTVMEAVAAIEKDGADVAAFGRRFDVAAIICSETLERDGL
jgi:hypothetical protein